MIVGRLSECCDHNSTATARGRTSRSRGRGGPCVHAAWRVQPVVDPRAPRTRKILFDACRAREWITQSAHMGVVYLCSTYRAKSSLQTLVTAVSAPTGTDATRTRYSHDADFRVFDRY